MEVSKSTEYHIQPNDMTAFVSSLDELFDKFHNKVTPLMLAESMSAKTGRTITYQNVSYLLYSFSFITRIGGRLGSKTGMRYIVQDDEILERLKKDCPNMEARTLAYKGKIPMSPLSIKRSQNMTYQWRTTE